MYNPFKKKYNEGELKLFDFLSGVTHFNKLTQDEMYQFLPYMYLRNYTQNEVVFFSGDPSHALYIIKEGDIALSIDIKDKFEQLSTVKSGHSFGDNSFLENTKRIYHAVVTSEQAEIYVIPQINLLDILNTNPKMKAKVMTSIANMYNKYTTRTFKDYKSSFGFFELANVYKDNI